MDVCKDVCMSNKHIDSRYNGIIVYKLYLRLKKRFQRFYERDAKRKILDG
jgi:hypothetical protein